ncbi:hypothetical protein C6499_08440 [Candidatus Poribacteria bacterium]|nr:MAG: hypothetical protein C6499_08440 [Candidatus Poribacteria bacterium]
MDGLTWEFWVFLIGIVLPPGLIFLFLVGLFIKVLWDTDDPDMPIIRPIIKHGGLFIGLIIIIILLFLAVLG